MGKAPEPSSSGARKSAGIASFDDLEYFGVDLNLGDGAAVPSTSRGEAE